MSFILFNLRNFISISLFNARFCFHVISSINIQFFLIILVCLFRTCLLTRLNVHQYRCRLILRSNAMYFTFKSINSSRRTITLVNKYKTPITNCNNFEQNSQQSFPDGSFNPTLLYLFTTFLVKNINFQC